MMDVLPQKQAWGALGFSHGRSLEANGIWASCCLVPVAILVSTELFTFHAPGHHPLPKLRSCTGFF